MFRKSPWAGVLARFTITMLSSAAITMGVIYVNYYIYWKRTIYRTQTVDFNILANLLPSKLSTLITQRNTKEIQKTIDSNYGLFGILITDCSNTERSCPGQKIIYASNSKIINLSHERQRLFPTNDYVKTWSKNFQGQIDSRDLLESELFLVLRNPSPLSQEVRFPSPRDEFSVTLTEKNLGNVIGRVYLLRAAPPSFLGELEKWFLDIPNNISFSGNVSSRSLVYNAIAMSSLLAAIAVWLVLELAYRKTRLAQQNEKNAIKAKLMAESKLNLAVKETQKAKEAEHQATKASEQALREAHQAVGVAHRATKASEQAQLERQQAEEALLAVSEQAQLERQRAEEVARRAAAASEQALREKQQAEEVARRAAAASEQALREKQQAKVALQVVSEQAQLERQRAEEVARRAAAASKQAQLERQQAEEALLAVSEQAQLERQQAEEVARRAAAASKQAQLERQQAEEVARRAVEASKQAQLERQQAEEALLAVSEQAQLERQQAEEVARRAAAASEQALREKQQAKVALQVVSEQAQLERQQAEEVARRAAAASEQALREKQEAEEASRRAAAASGQAQLERQQAEEVARRTAAASEQALREKQQAEEAAEQAKVEANDLYDSIQEEIERVKEEITREAKEKNVKLEAINNQLESENGRLKTLSLDSSEGVLFKLTERDLYPQERKNLLLAILKEAEHFVGEDTRRAHILENLIENNVSSEETEELKEQIHRIFTDYRRMSRTKRSALREISFEIISQNSHYKIQAFGDNRYIFTVSTTPSAYGAGRNIATQICRKLL